MEDILFWVDWIFIIMSTAYMIMSDADSLVFTVVPASLQLSWFRRH